MGLIKRKILLEDYISRNADDSYGKLTAETFSLNVFLTQEMKDMGMYIDLPYIAENKTTPTYTPLVSKLTSLGFTFNFMLNRDANFVSTLDVPFIRQPYNDFNTYIDKFFDGETVTGLTEDRLDVVASYGFDGNDKYQPDFDVVKQPYINYKGETVNRGTRVISNNFLAPVVYTEDADRDDPNLGTLLQSDGILFTTNTGITRTITGTIFPDYELPLTQMSYQGQSFNSTNVDLLALTREEYLLYITQPPKVDSDIFISRGATTVLQSHLQLGEIATLEHLVNYGNGFYNIIR
jgi:hypothetical protein